MKRVGMRYQASSLDPCRFFIFHETGKAVGAFTDYIDEILGCGEPDVLRKIRDYLAQRFSESKLQESSLVHVGIESEQDDNFSAPLTQDEFAQNLKPLRTAAQLRASRQKTLSTEDIRLRQCKLGELCLLATVPRPDICARLARTASRVNSLQGSDVYRINDLVKKS